MQSTFCNLLLSWYKKNARELPWRKENPSPYEVLLSETMLQQTRVEAVKEYYLKFLLAYPTLEALSKAEEDDLFHLWQGLGYYRRAENLLKTAKILQNCKDFPVSKEELLKLPGIGEYTSSAIRAIAFHEKDIAIDGNFYRIYSRLNASPLPFLKAKKVMKDYFMEKLGDVDPSAFNQACMDLGELVCLPNGKPLCESCPLSSFCLAHQKGEETSYPQKEEGKEKRQEHLYVYLLQKDGKYYLRKRDKKGLLSSLYEFPNFTSPLALSNVTYLGKSHHTFTHLYWEMDWYTGETLEELPSYSLYSKEEILNVLAIPSAFRFGINKIKKER